MIRKNIFETLEDNYNIKEEINNISFLFDSALIISYTEISTNRDFYSESIEEFVTDYLFHKWESRKTCLSCKHMRKILKIDELKKSSDFNDISFCLEYYLNILQLFLRNYKSIGEYFNLSNNLTILYENINTLMEHINYQIVDIKNEERVLIVPKNPASTAAAEVSSKQTGIAILKYHHALLKGNLNGKRNLLAEIALEYEPILNSPKDLFSKTRALLNNLNIRHNNAEGKNAQVLPQNLEEWYDDLYDMLLLCKLENENVSRMSKVQALLDTMSKKTDK
ncbi:MAG: hypothetical protein FWF35_02410 [Elusimicrobia bacterium]|nr:hypothetical protein [Elusimicrobiota bacterium]